MSEKLKAVIENNRVFTILTVIAVGLLVTSFILPPTGVIDPSVIAAVGEIMGLFALWVALTSLSKGLDAKFQHGNTTLTVGNLDEGDVNENREFYSSNFNGRRQVKAESESLDEEILDA